MISEDERRMLDGANLAGTPLSTGRHVAARLVVVMGMLAAFGVSPLSAKIIKTKPGISPNGYKELQLVIGSGVEVETDSEHTQVDLPFLVEYGISKNLLVTIEPNFVRLHEKGAKPLSGWGDLETTLTAEFVNERRYRPALDIEGVVKWATASRAALGTGQRDYSVGAIISKEFVGWDLDTSALYTFVGSSPRVRRDNTAEFSVSSEWHVGFKMDLVAEVLGTTGGGFRGQGSGIGHLGSGSVSEPSASEMEATLGLAQHVTRHLKLEEGGVLTSDGSWQGVAAWEWDFGEGN